MKLKEVVGMNLKYFRYKTGKSQEKFYTDLNLNHKYLASVERGEENLSMDYIEILAHKLKLDLNDLLLYNPEHEIKQKRIDEKIKQ